MKPPICCICHEAASDGGDLVRFLDYTPLPNRSVGHPHGLEWFCGKHLGVATQLSHLPTAEAKAIMSA